MYKFQARVRRLLLFWMAHFDCEKPFRCIQLPADVLCLVFNYLPRRDLVAVRRCCRQWNSCVLQDAQHVELRTDPCPAAVDFLNRRLPKLSRLSIRNTESVFALHTLTQLSKITLRWALSPCAAHLRLLTKADAYKQQAQPKQGFTAQQHCLVLISRSWL